MGNKTSKPSSDPSQCPILPTPLDDADKVIGSFTVHQFLQILAGACGIVAIVVSLLLFFQHACNIRNPREQIKIMRIITIIPVFAGLSYASLCLGQNSIYLTEWIEVWESFCVASFFLLVLTYIHADPDTQMDYFEKLPLWNWKKQVIGQSSAAFYKKTRVLVLQMVPMMFLLAIIQDIAQAASKYCINSNSPHFAHIWITVIHGISTSATVLAILNFCSRLRSELPGRHLWSQLFVFKTIIGLNFFQDFVFSIVAGQATPTNILSYNDISVGLPNALIIIEMMIFAALFHKFYSYGPYKAGGAQALSQGTVMSPWLAVAKALNPLEVIEGVVAAFTGKAGGKRAYRMQDSYGKVNDGRSSEEEMMPPRPTQTRPHLQQVQSQGNTEYVGSAMPYGGPAAPHGEQAYYSEPGRPDAYGPPQYAPPRYDA